MNPRFLEALLGLAVGVTLLSPFVVMAADWKVNEGPALDLKAHAERPYIVIHRDGERIISIDVYPPKGVPVRVHREGK